MNPYRSAQSSAGREVQIAGPRLPAPDPRLPAGPRPGVSVLGKVNVAPAIAAKNAVYDPSPAQRRGWRGTEPAQIRRGALSQYERGLDGRDEIFDEQSHLMQYMYIGQEGAPPSASDQVAAATVRDDTVATIAPQSAPQLPRGALGFEEYYYLLDTVPQGLGRLPGPIVPFSFSTFPSQQSVVNAVSLRICDSFFIPAIAVPNTYPEFAFTGRVYAYLPTLATTQAVFTAENVAYHFAFKIEDASNRVAWRLRPIEPDFILQRRIDSITDLSFQFFLDAPFRVLTLPLDTVLVEAVNGTNPGQFRLVGTEQSLEIIMAGFPRDGFVASYPYQLDPPVAVSFSVLTSYNVIPDVAQRQKMLDEYGHMIARLVSPTIFEVAGLDFSGADFTGSYRAKLFVRKNRVALQVRISSVKEGQGGIVPRFYS